MSLPDNGETALRKPSSTWASLQKDPILFVKYSDVFEGRHSSNIIENVLDECAANVENPLSSTSSRVNSAEKHH